MFRTNEIFLKAGATKIRAFFRGENGKKETFDGWPIGGHIEQVSTCKHAHPAGYNEGHTAYFTAESKEVLHNFCNYINKDGYYNLKVQ